MAFGYIGQTSVEAFAGPTMPANVASANNIITTQPYYNLIIQLAQSPMSSASGNNTITASQVSAAVAQQLPAIKSLSPSQLQTQIAPLLALWSFLPTYLANAPIVDAWNQQNGIAFIYNTQYGQTVQSYLQQLFAGLGVTPPSTSNGTSNGTNSEILSGLQSTVAIGTLDVPVWALLAGCGVLLLVVGGSK